MRTAKAIVRIVYLAVVTFLCTLPLLAARALSKGEPREASRLGLRLCSLWGKAACGILGVDVEMEGRPPQGRFVLVSNHLSYLDIWVLGALCPSVFVAKREISGWPVFGWIARHAGTLFIDRGTARDVVRVGRLMTDCLEYGLSLTVFPEGQATRGHEVLPFQPPLLEPAARAEIPCWAATLHYDSTDPEIDPGQDLCWAGSASFPPHILKVAGARSLRARVRFSETPVVSSSRKALAERLEREVRSRFTPIRHAGTG